MHRSCFRWLALACWLDWASLPASLGSDLDAGLAAINAPDFQTHIDVLAGDAFEGREAGTRGGKAASTYLLQQFEKRHLRGGGDRGGYFQSFRGSCRNVLGILEGSDPDLKNQYLVVGAHFDHVGYGTAKTSLGPIGYIHNGADDNASGVAGVLELQEAFWRSPNRPGARSCLPCGTAKRKACGARSTGLRSRPCRWSRSSWWRTWT